MRGPMGSWTSPFAWGPWCYVGTASGEVTVFPHSHRYRRVPARDTSALLVLQPQTYSSSPYGHFFSLPPQHRKTVLPESLLSPTQWQNERDSVFLCGSHTVSSIPKIESFGPRGVWLLVKVLLVLFTAFSRIQMSQKIEARNTFMWETV